MARILLAEDDTAARALVARGLAADGHAVSQAEDGQAALTALLADPSAVDVLVTDVEMPLLDGVELARRALAAKPDLKVLLISGHAQGFDKAADLIGRTVRSLAKPATLDRIREEVRRLLA